jgi:hypothetical protein
MKQEQLVIFFRTVAILFASCTVLFFYLNFKKSSKNRGKKQRALGILAGLFFVALVWIIFYNADYKIENLKTRTTDSDNPYADNKIFKDIAVFIGIILRLIIFGIIAAIYIYLFRKSKKYPQLTGIKIHRILLICGFLGVPNFLINAVLHFLVPGTGYLHFVGVLDTFFIEFREVFNSFSYLEIMPFGIYTGLFAGNMIWFLICSIVAAAALPEEGTAGGITKKEN